MQRNAIGHVHPSVCPSFCIRSFEPTDQSMILAPCPSDLDFAHVRMTSDDHTERKCADTIGTVPVPWAGHSQC